MGLEITGYILEPIRVGSSNSPFTSTPDIVISSQGAFDTAYPTAETEPRTEYHVFILDDGKFTDTALGGSPVIPNFVWTKNEVINRFTFDGKDQRFFPLAGGSLEVPGTLELDGNSVRLSVTPPLDPTVADFPVRISIGTGSGTSFPVTIVATDGDFGSPGAGTVELSQDTGNLNWDAGDLTTFEGQSVRFQRQTFFTSDESNGNMGLIDDALLLSPIPATGQFPLLRIGFGVYLTPVEVASEAGFSPDPTIGTVEWALDTGRLKFNSTDTAANTGRAIYYDGAAFGFRGALSTLSGGTVTSPAAIGTGFEGSDIFFTVPGTTTFPGTDFVDSFSLSGARGRVEVRRSDGQLAFSLADQVIYGASAVTAVLPDLTIERGMAVRFFRTPVDPGDTDDTLKDVASLYTSVDSTLADPVIGSPFVTLPAVPRDDLSLTVTVSQGTGSFTGVLPRLDVPAPPSGFGYIIDYELERLQFARRREDVVVSGSVQAPYLKVQLPDPGLFEAGLVLELEDGPGLGTFTPLVLDEEVLIDRNSALATLVTTDGTLESSGTTGSFSGTTLTDTTKDFSAASVIQGDFLIVTSGPAAGIYTIDTVGTTTLTTDLATPTPATNVNYEIRRGKEVLADRFFRDVPPLDPNTRVERLINLGPTANAPRLSIDLAYVTPVLKSRFRFGKTTFAPDAQTVTVASDASFTAPASLAQGSVEISLATGNLNFSDVDVAAGLNVYWARELTIGTEFQVNATLGFIEFTERMLENEETFITYVRIDDDDNRVTVEERGVFLVRKEVAADHPEPTSVLFFNPLGREVASTPSPKAFRGGRPQVTGEQASFNTAAASSTVTFLTGAQVTDALPSGSTVNPEERVHIDYFIHEAIGGEQSLTVIQPPFVGVTINIEADTAEFTIAGDRTTDFKTNHLLRVTGDTTEVYLLSGSSFDAGTDLTTVTLAGTQVFRSDILNPALAVTSGQTRVDPVILFPSYFVTEFNSFNTVSRGANRFRIVGDVRQTYQSGVVVLWTTGAIEEFNIVEGSTFDEVTNRTEIVLASNGVQQYTSPSATLRRSIRPVLPSALADVNTQRSPELASPFTVWRRVEGEIGLILVSPDDYTIDESGRVSFTAPLQEDEELSIFYTGGRVIEDGRSFRASYSHTVVPDSANGILNQILKSDYTTFAPDSFFWRVETMTNFRAELAEQFEDDAQSNIPTGGPRLENASSPALFEQGRESLFFQERHLANEDIVARATLKWYNDGVNLLEDTLQSMDGRVVGDHDGRFLFDGLIDNPDRTTFADVTNQIDDSFKVSEGPPVVTFPPFGVTFAGTFLEVYKPSQFSRFFPTKRNLFGVAPPPTGLSTDDIILDTEFRSFSSVSSVRRRQPWAVVTEAAPTGALTLAVDDTGGAEDLLRPAFLTGSFTHLVAIQLQDGSFVVDEYPLGAPLEVASTTATSITLTAPTPASVPVGATIYQVALEDPLSPSGTPFPKFFRPNADVGVNLQEGTLLHIEPFPPLDGSLSPLPIPTELTIQNPADPAIYAGDGEVLDVFANIINPLVEPDRIPALDGGTQDDDRNRQFPILNPSAEAENSSSVGFLPQEEELVRSGGTLRAATTAPFIGVGSLNVARTIITLDSGTFPAPAPKINDLVRILSGVNVGLDFRRVIAATAMTVTIAGGDAWPTQESGISFTVTVSTPLETGAASGVLTVLTTLTDAGATFSTNGVQIGHTVVATSGVNIGLRRQVTAVTETVLTTDAWPANDAALSYTVDDPLQTFGGATGSLLDALETNLDGEIDTISLNAAPVDINSQIIGMEGFVDNFFTDLVVSATGVTTSGLVELTDTSVDFQAAGVDGTHFVFVRSGDNAGVYKVDAVTSATTLDVDSAVPFPDTSATMSYRVVDSGGLILQTLVDVQSILAEADSAFLDVAGFRTLILTVISVLGDAGAYANEILIADLDTRETEITARLLQLDDPGTGAIALLSSALSSSDRLYERRFVWIDGRINQEKGILAKKDRALDNRIKAEADTLKSLIKLLTT